MVNDSLYTRNNLLIAKTEYTKYFKFVSYIHIYIYMYICTEQGCTYVQSKGVRMYRARCTYVQSKGVRMYRARVYVCTEQGCTYIQS